MVTYLTFAEWADTTLATRLLSLGWVLSGVAIIGSDRIMLTLTR